MPEHKEANKVNKELEDSRDKDDKVNLSRKKLSYLLISMTSYQQPLRYVTAI